MVIRQLTILIGLGVMLTAAPADAGEKKTTMGLRHSTGRAHSSAPARAHSGGVGLNRFIREGTRAASTPSTPSRHANSRSGGHVRAASSNGHSGYRSYGSVHVSTGYHHNGVRVGFGVSYGSQYGGRFGVSYGYSAPLWSHGSYRYYGGHYYGYPRYNTIVRVVNPVYYEPDVVYGWLPNEPRGFTPQEKIAQEFPAAAFATTQTTSGGALGEGWSRLAAGQPGAAAQVFAKDAEANKTDVGAWVGFSMALASQDDLRQAVWAMRRALERSGGAVDALPDNAALRLRARSLVDRYMTIVAADGDNADALLMVGAFAAMAGNAQLAYDSARASHEAEPDQASKNLLDRLAPPTPEPADDPEAVSDTPTQSDPD